MICQHVHYHDMSLPVSCDPDGGGGADLRHGQEPGPAHGVIHLEETEASRSLLSLNGSVTAPPPLLTDLTHNSHQSVVTVCIHWLQLQTRSPLHVAPHHSLSPPESPGPSLLPDWQIQTKG